MNKKKVDIRERSFDFAVSVVKLCQYLEKEKLVGKALIQHLLRAGQSTADFISKNAISLKEARESNYWLRLILATTNFDQKIKSRIGEIKDESDELMKIAASTIISTKR